MLIVLLLSFFPGCVTVSSDARDNSFSRSRSSSVTSIDRESREVISSFYFCDSLSKKSETVAVPSLWVGTSLGSMLAIALTVPATPEQRMQQPVGVSFCGKMCLLLAVFPFTYFYTNFGILHKKTPDRNAKTHKILQRA